MRSHLEKYRVPYGSFGTVVALIIAVTYLVVVPDEALESSGVQKLILMYGHSLCWVLLSMASYLWGVKKHKKLLVFFAYSALITYMIFIISLMIAKSA